MPSIEILESGLIYANPMPHLRSRQAIFPTVVRMPSGDLLAAFTVGEAFESVDGHTELARSKDDGRTWEQLGPLPRTATPFPTSESGRLSITPAGEVLCFGPRLDRSDPELPIGNADTNGFLDAEAVFYRSCDEGRTWSEAEVIPIPLPRTYEVASPIVPLSDGRWLAPFSTWRNWEGVKLSPERAYAMVSMDEGKTWPEMITTFADPTERVTFWEQRIIELDGGRLLAIAWCHDHETGQDRPNQFAIAENGWSFGPWRSTGLPGQTCTPLWLGGDRLLCVYNHRFGEPGVRAVLVRMSEENWKVEHELVIWGQSMRSTRQSDNVVGVINHFRFGFPMVLRLSEQTVLISHWCMEDQQLVARWTRVELHL